MGIRERELEIRRDLSRLEDPGAQCDYLMYLGMGLKAEAGLRQEPFRIRGCKTAIWLKAEEKENKIHLSGDSDSLLVKGVLALLGRLYEGQALSEARGHPPDFMDQISDQVIYPEIRENGIASCYQRLCALCIKEQDEGRKRT